MRELKNLEIEAVCGGAAARRDCGAVVAVPVPVRRPSSFEALFVALLSGIFGTRTRTPITSQA